MKLYRYVDIVSTDTLGNATEQDLADYCKAAYAWLTEHEGPEFSIDVRPPRRGEAPGLFYERGGLPFGPAIGSQPEDEYDARAVELIEKVWQLYCRNELL